MSIAIRNLEGRTKGSIHNLTFYMYRDINVVRIKPSYINNPKTQKQQLNRSNMAPCLKAYQSIKPILYKSLNNRPDNLNVFHQFAGLNLSHSFVNGIFQPENFIISGNCFNSDIFNYQILQSGLNNFRFTWDSEQIGYKEYSDIFSIVYYNDSTKEFHFILSKSTRQTGKCDCIINLGPQNSKTYFYLFFIKSNYSDSGAHTIIEHINN